MHAQYIWYSGYSYHAARLLNTNHTSLNKAPAENWVSLKNQIDIANYHWINRDYYNCVKTLNNAIVDARQFLPQNELLLFTIKTKHLIWEKALFAGRWEEALVKTRDFKQYTSNPLGQALYTYQNYTLMTKGDVALIEADRTQLEQLKLDLVNLGLNRMALSVAMKQLQNKFLDINETRTFVTNLPSPLNKVGLLELYYYSGAKNPAYLTELIQHIPVQDYLTQFRISIELTKHYAQQHKLDSFYFFQKQSKLMATYLADADVDNHYNSTLIELVNQKLIPQIFSKNEVIKTAYHWRTESRVGLYNNYNNQRVQQVNGQYLKQLQLNNNLVWGLVTLVLVLLVAVYYIYKSRLKIKQINLFRHQFVFALSHDLNATLSELELFALQAPNLLPEELLVEHRLMLNDTLLWAKTANQSELIKKDEVSLSDLMHECVDQLQSLITAKKLTITWLTDEDTCVFINKPAMQVTMRNVLLNAIKHNTTNGYININVNANKIGITNSSILHQNQQSSTGSYLINYFTAVNKAKYTLYISNQTAYCQISL